jgi:hypothetical protein
LIGFLWNLNKDWFKEHVDLLSYEISNRETGIFYMVESAIVDRDGAKLPPSNPTTEWKSSERVDAQSPMSNRVTDVIGATP